MSEHDSNVIRTTVMVIAGLFLFMVIIIIAARAIVGKPEHSKDPAVQAKIEEQIKPVAQVEVAGAAPAAAGGKVDGQAVYNQSCMACHGTGAAGAPKSGDKGAWKSRIAQGNATLYTHALKGFKGMPAKGGNPTLADDAVKAAVDYMVSQSK